MSAESIAIALGGRRVGNGWMVRCPAHDDQTPSLSLRDGPNGSLWLNCFAGCPKTEVILCFKDMGLWNKRLPSEISFTCRPETFSSKATNDKERTQNAISIWKSSQPVRGTLGECYLQSRGLQLPTTAALRYHPALNHPFGKWPAMVALVTRGYDGISVGIHRTYLALDGTGKAPVNPQKMMLGPCRGGVVRLAEPADVLMVGEGIETSLAAMQATGLPAWAALSTSGLKSLRLPESVLDVIVLADGDEAGEAAAQTCAKRWIKQGRRVRIARPPEGLDFNDLLINPLKAEVER
jgi:putative DNA primase/helicase